MSIKIDGLSYLTEQEAEAIINQRVVKIIAGETQLKLVFESGLQLEVHPVAAKHEYPIDMELIITVREED